MILNSPLSELRNFIVDVALWYFQNLRCPMWKFNFRLGFSKFVIYKANDYKSLPEQEVICQCSIFQGEPWYFLSSFPLRVFSRVFSKALVSKVDDKLYAISLFTWEMKISLVKSNFKGYDLLNFVINFACRLLSNFSLFWFRLEPITAGKSVTWTE